MLPLTPNHAERTSVALLIGVLLRRHRNILCLSGRYQRAGLAAS